MVIKFENSIILYNRLVRVVYFKLLKFTASSGQLTYKIIVNKQDGEFVRGSRSVTLCPSLIINWFDDWFDDAELIDSTVYQNKSTEILLETFIWLDISHCIRQYWPSDLHSIAITIVALI